MKNIANRHELLNWGSHVDEWVKYIKTWSTTINKHALDNTENKRLVVL